MQLYGQYLNFCKANGFRGHINFTGGEPLLSPDLFELLKRCDADGISCGILTNGTLIDRETAARLGTIRSLSFVQVSIDGTRETHDRVRGKGNFDKAFAGLKLLRRQGIQTMAAFTCHKGNYRTLPQVIRTVRRKGSLFVALFLGGVGIGIPAVDALIVFALCVVVTALCISLVHAVTARLKIEQLFKYYWTVVSGLALVSLVLAWYGL